jgi:hypothetical protein
VKPLPDDVAALRAEAAPPAPEPVDTVAAPQAGVVIVARNVVTVVGNAVCRRAGVPALTPDETELLGGAVAELVRVYDLAQLDPRAAAWLGFGAAAFAVSAPRLAMIERRSRTEPRPAPEPIKAEEVPSSSVVPPVSAVSDIERDGAAFRSAPA